MDVINMSLGSKNGSRAAGEAVKAASAAGVLVVSGAGNLGCCDTATYPAKFPESMAVAAVNASDERASFSSTGPEMDIAAPGVNVSSLVPNCPTCCTPKSGTSMAAPHVAGVGALLMSRGLSNVEAWYAMTETANDLGDAGFDTLDGYCRVDALAASPMR
jgi:subtilisin